MVIYRPSCRLCRREGTKLYLKVTGATVKNAFSRGYPLVRMGTAGKSIRIRVTVTGKTKSAVFTAGKTI